MSKQVALYGGSFDPITLAHEMVCQCVHDSIGCEIWTMPCWKHRFGKNPTPAHHRWSMLQLFAKRKNFVKPCSWELDNQHSGSMYETVANLKILFPKTNFHIVIGMDNANVIDKWDKGLALIQENPFVIITRKGIQPLVEWHLRSPHQLIDIGSSISSTQVREAIYHGDVQAQKMVSSDVWDYIISNNLYNSKQG